MKKSEKEYGKLSLGQFKQLVGELPDIRSQMKELPDLLCSAPKDKIKEVLDQGLYWAVAYELSFQEFLALLICALGCHQELHKAAQSDDPTQAAFSMLQNVKYEAWEVGLDGLFEIRNVVALFTALQRNVLSIMLFHRTLNPMVNEVRDGNDDSFFDAVRIDRSIITCPTFALRISMAEVKNDKKFFIRLGSSLKGPSKKHWEPLATSFATNQFSSALVMVARYPCMPLNVEACASVTASVAVTRVSKYSHQWPVLPHSVGTAITLVTVWHSQSVT